MVIIAKRVAHLVNVTAVTDPDGDQVVCSVSGELFFASSLTAAHIWDTSSVAALDAITMKYEGRGKTVEIIGLNQHSATMHNTLSGELTGSH